MSSFAFAISKWLARNIKFDIQHHADDGMDACFFRCLVKRNSGVQPVRIRQRHGRHFLLNRCRDDFLRRPHASSKGIMAMTMQMYEHGSPTWKGRRQVRLSAALL